MMTAGQIAHELGVNQVTITYKCFEILDEVFDRNPYANLEFTKYKCNYLLMQQSKKYKNSEFFPKDVMFQE